MKFVRPTSMALIPLVLLTVNTANGHGPEWTGNSLNVPTSAPALEVSNTTGPAANLAGSGNYALKVSNTSGTAAWSDGRGLGSTGSTLDASAVDGRAVAAVSQLTEAITAYTYAGAGPQTPALLLGSRGYGAVVRSPNLGVKSEAGAFGGLGVYGSATGGSGVGLYGVGYPNGTGVYGASDTGPGVHGYSSTGYAGHFYGNVNIVGTLSKGGGGFKIDHPLDPANKFLSHSFVESPDMKTIYDGLAVLDANGQAVVDLPDWFEALNRDFRYQLTAIGSPAPDLHIAEEIASNRFRIAGGPARGRVSWQVTAIRRDAYAEHHRVPVEEEKSAAERGKYLYPVENGQSERLGIYFGDVQRAETLRTEMAESSEEFQRREAELLKRHEDLQER